MHHNAIEQVDKISLTGGQHIQQIDLSSNRIETLPEQWLAQLVTLRIVDLSANRLRALPRNLFEGSSIDTLNLARNHLSTFPVGCLTTISSTLTYLDLSHNQVCVCVPTGSFSLGFRLISISADRTTAPISYLSAPSRSRASTIILIVQLGNQKPDHGSYSAAILSRSDRHGCRPHPHRHHSLVYSQRPVRSFTSGYSSLAERAPIDYLFVCCTLEPCPPPPPPPPHPHLPPLPSALLLGIITVAES